MQLSFSKKRIEALLLKVIVFLSVLSVSGQIYKFTVGRERFLVSLFDLDLEWNIPTLYSAVTLGLTSFLLFVIAFDVKVREKSFRLHWTILSAGFLVMAVDEIIQFHEKLSTPIKAILPVDGVLHFAWIVPFFFLVVFLLLAYVRFLLHLPLPMRIRVISAAAVYLTGAMGIEAVSGIVFTRFGRDTLFYAMVVNIEEIMEMVGIYLFISTLLNYLCENVRCFEVRLTAGRRYEAPVPGRLPKLLRPAVLHPNRLTPDQATAGYATFEKVEEESTKRATLGA